MKSEYIAPSMRLFSISADERVAANCGGGSQFINLPEGCTEVQVAVEACSYGSEQVLS